MSTVIVYTIHVGLCTNGSPDFVDLNRACLLSILDDRHAVGYTVVEGVGSFNGETEPTMLVSIYGNPGSTGFDMEEMKVTAKLIKRKLKQEQVWITRSATDLTII